MKHTMCSHRWANPVAASGQSAAVCLLPWGGCGALPRRRYASKLVVGGLFTAFVWTGVGAEVPKAPVPPSPFLPVVYRYADAMLERGRDLYGPQKTGLFLSALDRAALAPLTNRPPAPAGIREGDRVGAKGGPLTGANPQHDENLLRLLYTLSGLSGRATYRDAADTELKWFLQNAASSNTHLLPWGEHLSWDVMTDQAIAANEEANGSHEFFRPWLLWDRCFALAPDASRQFALGLWKHQIADHRTGAFNRHAGFRTHNPADGMDFPRHAGFYIRTWAVAFAHTKDEDFLQAIDTLLRRYEAKRHPRTGWIEQYRGQSDCVPALSLSLAMDCDGAAHRVPEPLATRLRAFAAREDEVFCALPHEVANRGGFVPSLDQATGQPADARTPLWDARYGGYTTAQIGMMCVARYDNNGKVGYRDLITNAANAYLKSVPPADVDVWPMTFGHAISLQVAAWRHTAKPEHLQRARELATLALETFCKDSPLPAAGAKCLHYETITGADTLALALVELHLEILGITAVRAPPNTIDR
jgi:hypothetical protein